MSENGSTTTTDKPKETIIATDKPKEQWNVTTNVENWGDQRDQGCSKRRSTKRRRRRSRKMRRRSTKKRRRTMRR